MAQPFTLYLGNCLDILKELQENSIDSIVCDPPYGISFMSKKWDYDVPSVEIWQECLRVLKPGGHLLAFASTRTQHRMACRIEDAGFEIRDMLSWIYSTGFPKSLDIGKAIDKYSGVEREVIGTRTIAGMGGSNTFTQDTWTKANIGKIELDITSPATEEANQWQGWGTALKPAVEPITMARKPLIGTVASNVLVHGTGGLNIDGCRVGVENRTYSPKGTSANNSMIRVPEHRTGTAGEEKTVTGRWPANLIHDGSQEVVSIFPDSSSPWIGNANVGAKGGKMFGGSEQTISTKTEYKDSGSASRFFYCAKASQKDREEGLDDFSKLDNEEDTTKTKSNIHPTVKPTELMRYLCRLVTPPNGIVLDPFMGSGSTGKAAAKEGFSFVGIDRDQEYFDIATARISHAYNN